MSPLLTVAIRYEHDVVLARQRARQIAALLKFSLEEQTRIATAVSELARNAFQYARGGKVEFSVEGKTAPQLLQIKVSDSGPGIANLPDILDGQYRSKTGMGLGIIGVRRLVDQFHIEAPPGGGTTIRLIKLFPKSATMLLPNALPALLDQLMQTSPENPFEEMQRQNQELLRALEELQRRQDELVDLNRELDDTNRGVVALYAELDEKADHLRRADELKTKFLSNMSHEFRTPLNSIHALCRILLDRADGPLTSEQETQIKFIQKGAGDLFDLVNDLLDLAKIEAGKVVIRAAEFDVSTLFSALRGMLRPLLVNADVQLIVEDPENIPLLLTDEGKISQILRNFLSNALKFTTKGEVRLTAAFLPEEDAVLFSVADTGIGIPEQDHERIFQEFAQLENPLQQHVKGTGLGLPLSRKLAELLGGSVAVESRVGIGSTFSVRVPRIYTEHEARLETEPLPTPDESKIPVLLVENDATTLLLYSKYLKHTAFQLFPVRTVAEARRVLSTIRPKAVILDILLDGDDAWSFLSRLKNDPATKNIPAIIVTTIEDQQKGFALGADAYCVKPVDRQWLITQLTDRTRPVDQGQVLIIDDEESSRYIVKTFLREMPYSVVEAVNGDEGLRLAKAHAPSLILLDLVMTDVNGKDVLAALKGDPVTRAIPVIIVSSQILEPSALTDLLTQASAFIAKQDLTHETLVTAIRHALDPVGLLRASKGAGEACGTN
jgi:signal transduction histidine kinase/CheY-like chemotaxis protein